MANIDANTVAIAQRAQEKMTIENGIIKFTGNLLEIEGTLPEGVTKEQYEAVQRQRNINAAALEYALGDAGNNQFVATPDLSSVTGTIHVGAEKWTGTQTREKQVDRASPEEKKQGVTKVETVYGSVSGGYSSKASAEHKRVRSHIADLAKNLYGQK